MIETMITLVLFSRKSDITIRNSLILLNIKTFIIIINLPTRPYSLGKMFSFYEIRKYNGDKKIMIKLRFIFNFFPKMFQPYPHSLSNLHFDPLPQEDLGPCTI